jgi:hypothetical protein
MAMQPWWEFNSTSSMSGNRDEGENNEGRAWFYMIASGASVN